MRRFVLVLSVAVIAAAAPLRAWCEATCIAPAENASSHCPTHEPAKDTTTISASDTAACRSLESARTSIPARLDVQVAVVTIAATLLQTRAAGAAPPVSRLTATTVFERCTPLRI